jgi:lysine-specific demethylase 8
MPEPARFVDDYVQPRRPVVITDLFESQQISDVRTADDAVRAWGSMEIQVQEEYTRAEGRSAPPAVMTLRDYVEATRADPSTRLCCTEYDTPARVLASFRLPDLCRATPSSDEEIFGLPKKYGDFDLATNIFVANQGNVAHLHFDGDHRQVLLHQVYGRKRVVLFQPSAAIRLRTLDGPFTRPSLAGLYLEDMSVDEKLEQVELADGYHTILEPGETIYIPMLMWHHLEYVEDSMSFSVRFGRNRFGRFLSLDNFHRDPYIQNVGSKFVCRDDELPTLEPVISAIMTAYAKVAPDMRQKVREMRMTFRELCAQVAPEACPERLCPPEREEEQIARIVEGRDLQGALKYADPAVIARTRPVGAITARQREIIENGFTSRGLPPEVREAVIENRLGKPELDELTKAEAAQLIAYLQSPGATW